MKKNSLADRVIRNFSRIRIKKFSVKVPSLKLKGPKAAGRKEEQHSPMQSITNAAGKKEEQPLPIQSITNILIKSAIEGIKEEKKEKSAAQDKSYKIKEERRRDAHGGYGSISRNYGLSPLGSYVDYGRLFSYLGSFKAQSGSENFENSSPAQIMNRVLEQGNKFYLVDREVIDAGVRGMKYFTHGMVTGDLSAVPIGNINSADWEKFKLWKTVDYVMFNLKMSTL